MKTKIFLLICLMLGIMTTQLSAQNGKGSINKTDVYDWPVPELVVTFEIVCDGVLVDIVHNTEPFLLRCRDHYKKGEFLSWNYHLNNILFVGEITGENFKLNGTERGSMGGLDYTFGNLIGDKGSHYILHIISDTNDWTVVESWAECH